MKPIECLMLKTTEQLMNKMAIRYPTSSQLPKRLRSLAANSTITSLKSMDQSANSKSLAIWT